jgi:hypothetical protein
LDKEVKQAKKVFKDAWDALDDFFDEKRSDEVTEKEKEAKKGKVALAKFHKGLVGKTNQINFRILIGKDKELGDHIYEAVYMDDKKEPYIYDFDINKGKPIKNILTNFKDPDWNGYKKVEKYKSLTKFLEHSYKNGIYIKGKKQKKEDALNALIKGLKRSLEAVGEDVKDKKGADSPQAQKIAKVIAITAATIIISAALTPAAGVVVGELAGGGGITGDLVGQMGQAAGKGLQRLADPTTIVKKVAKKVVTKGKKIIPGDD